jgi:cytochrome-b5 reductase
VSPTSSVLRFGLPDSTRPLNLSTCACILASASVQGADVVRPYTPISTNQAVGYLDLLVKDYGPEAKMSHHMCTRMQVGETIQFKHVPFNVKIQAPFAYDKILLLAGGTGITPMIQALHAILGDSSSTCHVTLLYGSQHQGDVLGKPLLDQWARDYADRFTWVPILSNEPDESDWEGERGFITRDLIDKYFVSSGSDGGDSQSADKIMIMVCGPPPLYKALCGPREEPKEVGGVLKEMGYTADQVYKF